MVKLLTLVFALVAAAAAGAGLWGTALLSLAWAALCLYAEVHFARQDRAWAASPHSALCVLDTRLLLQDSECDCIYVPAELADLEARARLSNSNEDPR